MECYFFGTFNPPHNGHIKLAYEIVENFGFDYCVFVPAFNPPHKIVQTPFKRRFEMLKLLENDKIRVSDIESRLPSPSYSCQTVRELIGNREKLNFIIGYDAMKGIESWHSVEYLKEKLNFIVLKRKGDKREDIEKLKQKGFNFVIADNIKTIDISSSEIREKVLRGEDIDGLVDEKIRSYINENGLYGRN